MFWRKKKKIDWEQRFYEVSKEYYIRYLSHADKTFEDDIYMSFNVAKEFIEKLKIRTQWNEKNK